MAFQRKVLLSLAIAMGLGGCAVGPTYQPPQVSVPFGFGGAAREAVAQDAAPEPQPDTVLWWHTLGSPLLNRLVETAVACNLDIEIALARVQALRTQQIVVIGSALPSLGANAAIAAGSGTDLTKGRAAGSLRSGTDETGLRSITRIAGFDAQWELDLFGRTARSLEAVRSDAQAMADMRSAVLITVIADVARSYVSLRGLQARLAIRRFAISAARQNVDIVQARFDTGLTNELDLTLARREFATFQALVPELEAAIVQSQSQLAVLLGTFSGEIAPQLRKAGPIPRPPTRLLPGVPADLLRRRPDIRAAERRLAAATARIGVAIADLFPTVSMTAGVGAQGGVREGAAASPRTFPIWSAGPGAYWPMLDFGRLDALINVQELQAHELFVTYKRTILVAVEEVHVAIQHYRAQQRRLRRLAAALQESRRAMDLAIERYDRGLTDFLNVLDAQRQAFALEDENAVAQEVLALSYIALYKALGGGWELYDVLPPLKRAEPALLAMARRLRNDWQ